MPAELPTNPAVTIDGVLHVGAHTDSHLEILRQVLMREMRLTEAELDRMFEKREWDWDDYFEGRLVACGYKTTEGRFVSRNEAWTMLTPQSRREVEEMVGLAPSEMTTDVLAQLYEQEPVLRVKRIRDDLAPACYRGREGD